MNKRLCCDYVCRWCPERGFCCLAPPGPRCGFRAPLPDTRVPDETSAHPLSGPDSPAGRRGNTGSHSALGASGDRSAPGKQTNPPFIRQRSRAPNSLLGSRVLRHICLWLPRSMVIFVAAMILQKMSPPKVPRTITPPRMYRWSSPENRISSSICSSLSNSPWMSDIQQITGRTSCLKSDTRILP